MNNVSTEEKDRVLKILAICGFVAVVVFGVWLAVQIVSLMPHAFSSLASLADSVYNHDTQTELTVTSNKTTVSSGESLTISWEPLRTAGTYVFAYACTEGVALDVRIGSEMISTVPCDEPVELGEDVTAIEMRVEAERQRFTDVEYTITFVPDNGADTHVTEHRLTVINASIPTENETADTDNDRVANDDDTADDETDPTPDTTTTEPQYRYIETVTYTTPTSDPHGTTDLAVRLIGVGEIDSDGTFRSRTTIDTDERGAFQFEVQNVGTKTSTSWDFIATLPSGTTYTGDAQRPLKPQERVVFTLSAEYIGDDGVRRIGVLVRGGGDAFVNNNAFSSTVRIVD